MSTILYVWQGQYPWDVRVEKIARSLTTMGHRVIVLARKRVEPMPELPFEVVECESAFNAPLPWSPIWTSQIEKLIRVEKVDLVIARDFWITGSSIRAAHSLGIPCVIDMAEHYPAAMRGWKKYNSNFMSRWLMHQARWPDHIEKWNVLHSDGILTVCEEQSQRLMEMGFPGNKICVVGNTPDLHFFSSEYPPPTKIIRIGHHGFMTPERGLEVLIKAFAIIKQRKPELQLVLAGTGESSQQISRLIEQYKINCDIQGRFQFQDLPRLISEVDAGILPYQLNEFLDHTLANKLFDYLACRRPVMVSNTRPFRRIISEIGAGWIVDVTSPENLARDILSASESYVEKMAFKGRQSVIDKYNWSVDQEQLRNFIKKSLSSKELQR